MKPVQDLVAVALFEKKADFALQNAHVFNVFTGQFEKKDVLVTGGYIAALISPEETPRYSATKVVDAKGQFLLPGFIDAHVHIESGMVSPAEFASMAASNGVTSLIADPHEICNVLGSEGLRYMLGATKNVSARVFFMLPSCVPASELEKSAYSLKALDLTPFLSHPRILGLGEMMNYPGVLGRQKETIDKIESIHKYNAAAFGSLKGMTIDGHAPFLHSNSLHAYIASGVQTDHEASSVEEALERLAAGMGLMLREGSGAKNLLDLVPAVNEHTAPLCMLCTDDRHPKDLVEEGSINFLVRLLIEDGRIPFATIIKMASYNTAQFFSLKDIGAIAPGYQADFALYSSITPVWRPDMVWTKGVLVAVKGTSTQLVSSTFPDVLFDKVIIDSDLPKKALPVKDNGQAIKVIQTIPRQLTTQKTIAHLPVKNGFLQADPQQDIAKLAVFERHGKTGLAGVGFVKGLGIKRGAIAATVAHDAHNLVVAGMNDDDMRVAALALKDSGGGFTVAEHGKIKALLPLPLAGLFSDKSLHTVCKEADLLSQAIHALGLGEGVDPFLTLAFLTLPVIPSMRLTTQGLVDVDTFSLTSLYCD